MLFSNNNYKINHLKPEKYTEKQSLNKYIYIEIYGFSDYSKAGNVEYVYS